MHHLRGGHQERASLTPPGGRLQRQNKKLLPWYLQPNPTNSKHQILSIFMGKCCSNKVTPTIIIITTCHHYLLGSQPKGALLEPCRKHSSFPPRTCCLCSNVSSPAALDCCVFGRFFVVSCTRCSW